MFKDGQNECFFFSAKINTVNPILIPIKGAADPLDWSNFKQEKLENYYRKFITVNFELYHWSLKNGSY